MKNAREFLLNLLDQDIKKDELDRKNKDEFIVYWDSMWDRYYEYEKSYNYNKLFELLIDVLEKIIYFRKIPKYEKENRLEGFFTTHLAHHFKDMTSIHEDIIYLSVLPKIDFHQRNHPYEYLIPINLIGYILENLKQIKNKTYKSIFSKEKKEKIENAFQGTPFQEYLDFLFGKDKELN